MIFKLNMIRFIISGQCVHFLCLSTNRMFSNQNLVFYQTQYLRAWWILRLHIFGCKLMQKWSPQGNQPIKSGNLIRSRIAPTSKRHSRNTLAFTGLRFVFGFLWKIPYPSDWRRRFSKTTVILLLKLIYENNDVRILINVAIISCFQILHNRDTLSYQIWIEFPKKSDQKSEKLDFCFK